MTVRSLQKVAAFGLILPLVAGSCMYGISEPLRTQARKENLTFSIVLKDPDAYKGRTVLWGGKILKTSTIADCTEIVVLQTALNSMGRPRAPESSQGIFIARTPDVLDPAVYATGGEIVLAGEVIGAHEKTSPGALTQKYPAVLIKELYLWDDYYYQDSSWYYWIDGH